MERSGHGDRRLIVIDVQNDFCPGGALAVAGGDEIVPLVNELIAGFRACDPDAGLASGRPFQLRLAAIRAGSRSRPIDDALWRADAVARPLRPGHAGADFHPASTWTKAELVMRKGFRPGIDSYSAFFENDRTTPTGLAGYLRERGIRTLTLVGLATDYLRRLFGARRRQARLRHDRAARCLPRHRPRRLAGGA